MAFKLDLWKLFFFVPLVDDFLNFLGWVMDERGVGQGYPFLLFFMIYVDTFRRQSMVVTISHAFVVRTYVRTCCCYCAFVVTSCNITNLARSTCLCVITF